MCLWINSGVPDILSRPCTDDMLAVLKRTNWFHHCLKHYPIEWCRNIDFRDYFWAETFKHNMLPLDKWPRSLEWFRRVAEHVDVIFKTHLPEHIAHWMLYWVKEKQRICTNWISWIWNHQEISRNLVQQCLLLIPHRTLFETWHRLPNHPYAVQTHSLQHIKSWVRAGYVDKWVQLLHLWHTTTHLKESEHTTHIYHLLVETLLKIEDFTVPLEFSGTWRGVQTTLNCPSCRTNIVKNDINAILNITN